MKKYEVRKIIYAENIVDAFKKDPQTPPDYLVLVDEGDADIPLAENIGFKSPVIEAVKKKAKKKIKKKAKKK